METRLIVAYGLIVLLALAVVTLALFIRHNTQTRKIARHRKRARVRRE